MHDSAAEQFHHTHGREGASMTANVHAGGMRSMFIAQVVGTRYGSSDWCRWEHVKPEQLCAGEHVWNPRRGAVHTPFARRGKFGRYTLTTN